MPYRTFIKKDNEYYVWKANSEEPTKVDISNYTIQDFLRNGMKKSDLSYISLNRLNEMKPFEFVKWTSREPLPSTTIMTHKTLYESNAMHYKGKGVVRTREIHLGSKINRLVFNAIAKDCTFAYSFDKGETWYSIQVGEVKDVSKVSSDVLMFEINCITEESYLKSIGYMWV